MKTIENGYRGYSSDFNRPDSYYETEGVNWQDLAKLKDRGTALYDKRWQAACEVIDIIARKVGIDPEKSGLCLYGVNWDSKTKIASSHLADKIDEWFDRSGDKVKLKKRIGELENENQVLRSLIGK